LPRVSPLAGCGIPVGDPFDPIGSPICERLVMWRVVRIISVWFYGYYCVDIANNGFDKQIFLKIPAKTVQMYMRAHA